MDFLNLLTICEISVILVMLICASYQDIIARRVKNLTWLPIVLFCVPISAINCILLYQSESFLTTLYLISAVWFSVLVYAAARVHIFGGADAIALILIALCVPVSPFIPLIMIPGLTEIFVFPVIVYFNAVLAAAFVPLWLFIQNIGCKDKVPLMMRCGCLAAISEDGRSVTWTQYRVPFIVPITFGFVLALIGV